ncbi:LacI family DNA-binding transcriptional regulator [Nocardia seriolae]|nr:LacI family DNA-binding transcriptional regulator [Nocardia seriolae]QOW34958.1 LacI family DNA-binding transcriptional regulator [Nocardia seriolae]QUN17577.1 LacI family DNA-binding transcriptional regulator [Nocardia seriolae]WKY49563.1 LacI family DNA-binding transcriptional regulator [Nocardia seriolae]WNJ62206.1 LacI family DNA-binding transcriptional regulator [Nocardia seriolae]BAW06692.1 LacI family transcriptional regulator [Nocardia seriolae]
MKAVAAAVGVSMATVSNAYNKPDQLSGDVRERIFAVARELGYSGPHAAARTLRSRRAGAIGLLLTEQLSYAFSDPFAVGLLAGLSEVAEGTRTGLLLIPLPRYESGADEESLRESVETVRNAVVDGVVGYCIDAGHPALEVISRRGLPFVHTEDQIDGGRRVVIDEVGAMRGLGAYLAGLGHAHVAMVVDSGRATTAPHEITDATTLYSNARLRMQGLRQGIGANARLTVVSGGHNSVESGIAAAALVLDRRDRPTAIAAGGDVLAFGVIEAMRRRGLVPGRDISVTGFDDVPAAESAGLTTVRQPIRDKGRLLGRMLLDPSYTEDRVVLPTELVIRSSTGPVRS